MQPVKIINYQAYPVEDAANQARQNIIDDVRLKLNRDGCAVLRQFLSAEGLQQLLAEAEMRKQQAYFSPKKQCNVYFSDGDTSYAQDHPVNRFIPRTNGFITADLLGQETAAHRLYHWQPLRRFLADCLGKEALFIYDDPISNMIVNVARPGQQFNWHFDTNEFTITILLKAAESGGLFEYVPGLRTPADECYDEVKKVLDGERSRVRQLELNAGDIQLFLGRFALHQVTPNTGGDDRLLLIMSFTEKPGVVGNRVRVKDLYGKLSQVHEDGAVRVRADALID
jgi:hypothetical protein